MVSDSRWLTLQLELNFDLLKKEGESENRWLLPNIDNFGRNVSGPLLRPDTNLSSVNFCIFLSNMGLHEATVRVTLGSHIAVRKSVRAHGFRKSVFYTVLTSSCFRITSSLGWVSQWLTD